jgi:gluconate 5-dehydrogenase
MATTATTASTANINVNANNYISSMFSLDGKCAIVTGGGTGIGQAISRGLAMSGAKVVLVGRRLQPLLDTCQAINAELQQTGNGNEQSEERAFALSCDVTNTDELANMVQTAQDLANCKPTILINNAGVNVRQSAQNLTPDHWDLSLKLMLTAPSMLTRAMADNFKTSNYGRIINVASLQTYQAFPNSMPYACAKSGCLGLTRAIAEEYSPVHGYDNVTCNAIAPGYVKTELTQQVFEDVERAKQLADATLLGRNSEPEDLVGAVVFLAGRGSSYITGQTIPVDGGFTSLGLR